MRKTDDRTNHFTVYREGNIWCGVADAELPALEALTETLKGSGINGEIDSPLQGHYAAMSLTLTWKTVSPEALALAEARAHDIVVRSSQQQWDGAQGKYVQQGMKASMRVIPKNTSPGKVAIGETTGTANEFSVIAYKLEVDEQVLVDIDVVNFKAIINGVDQLAAVRKNIGL